MEILQAFRGVELIILDNSWDYFRFWVGRSWTYGQLGIELIVVCMHIRVILDYWQGGERVGGKQVLRFITLMRERKREEGKGRE